MVGQNIAEAKDEFVPMSRLLTGDALTNWEQSS